MSSISSTHPSSSPLSSSASCIRVLAIDRAFLVPDGPTVMELSDLTRCVVRVRDPLNPPAPHPPTPSAPCSVEWGRIRLHQRQRAPRTGGMRLGDDQPVLVPLEVPNPVAHRPRLRVIPRRGDLEPELCQRFVHGAEHADASVAAGVEQDLPFPVHLHDVLVEYLHHGHAVVPLDVSGSMPIHLLALC